ncbi:MAG: HEAT repeat domain-containing protein [Singulisphaera sp.]
MRRKKAQPRDGLPAGAIGKVETSSGPLLRWNTERGEWERLNEQSPVKDRDRLLNLAPYRASLALGTARVELVGETELSVSTPSPDREARFRLEGGRVVVHGGSANLPFAVQFADRTVLVAPSAGSSVGLERSDRRAPGSPLPSPSLLRITSTGGEVALSVDNSKETLPGSGSIAFEPPGRWTDKSEKPAPSWVDDASPSPFDEQVGGQFLEFFRADRPIVSNLVEALDDDQKDVRRLAIAALGALGDLSMIVPVLSKEQDPSSRRAAATVLRDHLAHGPESAKRVQAQLVNDLGEAVAGITHKLLVGYTPLEAKEIGTYSSLVKFLSSDDAGIRELALDNLQSLTGRDTLDYDPDKPEGKGLKAWNDLLRDRELRPQATRNEP